MNNDWTWVTANIPAQMAQEMAADMNRRGVASKAEYVRAAIKRELRHGRRICMEARLWPMY